MALNRDKFRKIVGGITTAEPAATPAASQPEPPQAAPATLDQAAAPAGQGEGSVLAKESPAPAEPVERTRFAKRGRPKGRKDDAPAAKERKVKVSLFLPETLVNDLYDWAHEDRVHPGEIFERALRPFHEREAKRRNGGKA